MSLGIRNLATRKSAGPKKQPVDFSRNQVPGDQEMHLKDALKVIPADERSRAEEGGYKL